MSASSKKKFRKEQNAAALTEKQAQAAKEAKQLKTYTMTFVITLILVVVLALGAVVKVPISGAVTRGSHAVTIANHELSATDISYYFSDAVTEYYNELNSMYGDYAQYFMGFMPGEPLNEQKYTNSDFATWADYFLDKALDNAKGVLVLYNEAMAKGHKLTEEEQTNLDLGISNMKLLAELYGYSSANSYLRANYGEGANLETYTNYCTINTYASSYFKAHSDSIEYTDEQYRDFEKGKFNTYSSFTFATYTVTVSKYLTGGTKDANGTTVYSDEEKKAAQEAAKKDMETLIAENYKDLDAFNKAIAKLTINKDAKDVAATEHKDTLYTGITNTDIQKWVGNSARKEGDITSITTSKTVTNEDKSTTLETTAYQIVYFISANDNKTNLVDVQHILVKFEGGKLNSTTNTTEYTPGEKEKAKKEAEKLLQQWKDGKATKESFAELAKTESDDTGSKADGGLYEDVYPHQMTDAFNDWCFDSERKAGDTGIVETEYGYHVLYFVETNDQTYRDFMIDNEMLNKEMEEWHNSLKEKATAEIIDTKHVFLDYSFGG